MVFGRRFLGKMTAIQDKHQPDFRMAVEQLIIPTGYGPRFAVSSEDGKTMFFGCKDGQVMVVPDLHKAKISESVAEEGREGSPPDYNLFPFTLSCGEDRKGVRSLCEWHKDWLIIGRNDGHIDVVCWKRYVQPAKKAWKAIGGVPASTAANHSKIPNFEPESEAIEPGDWPKSARPKTAKKSEDPVNFLGWLNESYFAIACKKGGLWVIKADSAKATVPQSSGFFECLDEGWQAYRTCKKEKKGEASYSRKLKGVNFIARVGPERWALFSNHGQVWLASLCEETCTLIGEEVDVWGHPGPGFILDYSYAKPVGSKNSFKGLKTFHNDRLYVATDIGVYLLKFNEEAGLNPIEAVPIFLPEITNMCVAVTHFYWQKTHYLWVSDAESKGHLFRLPEKMDKEKYPFYRAVRQPALQSATNVIQAYACWHFVGKAPVLGQTRRNDRIVFAFFSKVQPHHPLRKILGGFDLDHWQENIVRFFENTKDSHPDLKWRGVDLNDDHPNFPELLLAEFFQKIREDKEHRQILIEFLQSPAPDLGLQVIRTMLGKTKTAKRSFPSRLKRALNLWTFTLLAIIHRLPKENQANCYLGLIRWLRGLEALSRDDGPLESLSGQIKNEIKSCLLFVRKWGVFGKSYTTRSQLNIPLDALDKQKDSNQDIDRLVYKSLLQERALDLEGELTTEPAKSNVALDLKWFEVHARQLGVVSWNEGGLRFFELDEPENERLAINWLPFQGAGPEWPGFMKGPSKCLAIRASGGEIWMANGYPVQKVEEGGEAKSLFSVSKFQTSEDVGQCMQLIQNAQAWVPGNESVCSLIWLAPNRLLAGLEGERENRLLLIDVCQTGDGLSLRIQDEFKFTTFSASRAEPYPSTNGPPEVEDAVLLAGNHSHSKSWAGTGPKGKQMPTNPVWVLAKDKEDRNPLHHIVFAGCDDGQVVQLMIPKDLVLGDKKGTIGYHVVDRLGAPVRALSCRYIQHPDDRESVYRVYAGAADGTIVCLQQVVKTVPDEEVGREKARFATLWATMEEGAISHCQAFPLQPAPTEENVVSGPVVGAITNQGRLVLFSDIETMSDSKTKSLPSTASGSKPHGSEEELVHQRHNIPGLRFGRQSLKDRVFAAFAVNQKKSNSRLILATGDGQIQVCTIACPEHTTERREVSDKLFALWNDVLDKGGHKAYLHIGEALYSAAQYVSRGLVYQLIDYSKVRDNQLTLEDRDWIPRHLRPLFDLDLAWRNGESQQIETYQYLRRALRDAYVLDDQELFKELVRVILKRANKHLFDIAQTIETAEGAENEKNIYLQIFDDIDASRALWQGHPEKAETRVDIVFAKNMVDGDAMWQVAMRSAKRKKASPKEAAIQKSFRDILWRRIDQVRTFLIKGDPLVALETLRACNLSLARASKRLVEKRMAIKKKKSSDLDWDPEDARQEMPWQGFRNFYETISDYAGRVLNRENNTSPALAHEISRNYALGACISPSAVMPIANRMYEAELPDDLIERTSAQFKILGIIGLTLPGNARTLFEMALEKEPDKFITLENKDLIEVLGIKESEKILFEALEVKESEKNLFEVYRKKGEVYRSFFDFMHESFYAGAKKKIGAFNTRAIFAFFSIDYIQNQARVLRKQLSSSVENINFLAVPSLKDELDHGKCSWQNKTGDTGDDLGNKYPFDDSMVFWKDTIELFDKAFSDSDIRAGEFIQPETVLISQRMARFFGETVKRLERLKQEHKIFQPMYNHWRQLFLDLELAAENFRESAAIQKSIVMGVLSHGLLGSMDELVLELGEMAQALDPFMFFQKPNGENEPRPGKDSMERRFAWYLRNRSSYSESVPKNLRSLQGLMEQPEGGGEEGNKLFEVLKGLGEGIWDEGLDPGKSAFLLDEAEKKTLQLTVGELVQNHKYHGYKHPERKPSFEIVARASEFGQSGYVSLLGEAGFDERKHSVAVFFTFYFWKRDFERIDSLEIDLQKPVQPFTNRDRPSHGTGLYLANFAAAVVGWRLEIVKNVQVDGEEFGKLIFKLSKHDKGKTP